MKGLAISLGTVALLAMACAPPHDDAAATPGIEVGAPQVWSATTTVISSGNLHFSPQPDSEALDTASAAGIEVVVNLRLPEEMDWDEQAAAVAAGMTYYNVPIASRGDSFDEAAISRIDEIVAQNGGKKILLHCSSGNRASAWYATHLARKFGVEVDQALVVARQTGLTKAPIEKRVRKFLASAP